MNVAVAFIVGLIINLYAYIADRSILGIELSLNIQWFLFRALASTSS